MSKTKINALKSVKVSLSEDEQVRLRGEAARRGFSTLKGYMRHAILNFAEKDGRASCTDIGKMALILHDIQALTNEKSTPITRRKVQSLVIAWETLCNGLLSDTDS